MKTVEDLRAHLFAALQGLQDGTLDVERARAISEVAQTVINSSKVEVEAARVADSTVAPRFLAVEPSLPSGINGIVRHRLVG